MISSSTASSTRGLARACCATSASKQSGPKEAKVRQGRQGKQTKRTQRRSAENPPSEGPPHSFKFRERSGVGEASRSSSQRRPCPCTFPQPPPVRLRLDDGVAALAPPDQHDPEPDLQRGSHAEASRAAPFLFQVQAIAAALLCFPSVLYLEIA